MTREESVQTVAEIYSRFSRPYTDRSLAETEIDVLTALGLLKVDDPAAQDPLINHWLKPGACVPVEPNTVSVLIREIMRMRSMPSPNGIKP